VEIPGSTRQSDDLVVRSCALAGTSSLAKLGSATPAEGAEVPKEGMGDYPGGPNGPLRSLPAPTGCSGPPRTGLRHGTTPERSGRGRGRRRTLWQGGLCDVDFGHEFWTPIGGLVVGE
jgi:hypothetical protein